MRKKFNIFLVFMMMLFTIPFGVYDVSAEDSTNNNEDTGQVTDTSIPRTGDLSDGSGDNNDPVDENPSGDNNDSGDGDASGDNNDSGDGDASGDNNDSGDGDASGDNNGSEGSSSEENGSNEEKYEPAEDQRVVGKLVTEKEAEKVYEMYFDTESKATKSQLENPVTVLVVGDKQYLQIKINDRGAQFFRSLKFDGEEVTWNNINEAPFIIQHELKNGIDSEISVEMVIDTGKKVMPHADIKLWLTDTDPDAVKEVKEEEKKGPKESKETKLVPDKAYNINYTILESNGKGTSVADTFFEKPGTLLVKDGKTYFQFTVTSASMIKSLSNKYGEALVVAEDKDKDKKVLQLRVNNDLSDMKLDMFISVPGLYSAPHVAILSFDKDSKVEIPVDGLKVLVSDNKGSSTEGNKKDTDEKSGKVVQGTESDNNNKQPKKPELGETISKDGTAASTDNPKTGDTSQILFFSSLLLLSLVVLVVQVRRRLAA